MTITVDLTPILIFIAQNPWPTAVLVFLLTVAAPAVWSRQRRRRHAALRLIRAVGDAASAIAAALRGAPRR